MTSEELMQLSAKALREVSLVTSHQWGGIVASDRLQHLPTVGSDKAGGVLPRDFSPESLSRHLMVLPERIATTSSENVQLVISPVQRIQSFLNRVKSKHDSNTHAHDDKSCPEA